MHASTLSVDALRDALERGDFYASTGVTISEITRSSDGVRILIQPETPMKYSTEFIGASGKVLKTSFESPASYTLAGTDRYVRGVGATRAGAEGAVRVKP